MTKISIVGAGAFGTALACTARRAGLDVAIWAREPEIADSINGGRGNPVFLPGASLETGIRASTDLAGSLRGADFVLMAVPSQFLRGVAEQMRPALRPGTPVVSCSKGIENGTCALMPEVIAQALPEAAVAVLAGPSFAKEVALGLPTGVTLAGRDRSMTEKIAQALGSGHFHIYTSDDPISATIGGAFKNVLAIACGIAIARKMGEHSRHVIAVATRGKFRRFGRITAVPFKAIGTLITDHIPTELASRLRQSGVEIIETGKAGSGRRK